ncbi:MAG: hypothetical protein LBH66_01260 [Oscillospiraceae bacterium]|jgi:hypothetical protein|nr:hypothetical protein [Oscillospiraceae bacterium]
MATVPFLITTPPDPSDAWEPGIYTIARGGIDWSALNESYSTVSTITLRAAPGVSINRLNAPLFKYVGSGSTFSGLTVEYAAIEMGSAGAPIEGYVQALGALVARGDNITLSNCRVLDGYVKFVYDEASDGMTICVGGLVGYASGIRADRCGGAGKVFIERAGGSRSGSPRGVCLAGVIGGCVGDGAITNSWNDAEVYCRDPAPECCVGGIAGYGEAVRIMDCWNNGAVAVEDGNCADGQTCNIYRGGIYGSVSGGDVYYCRDYTALDDPDGEPDMPIACVPGKVHRHFEDGSPCVNEKYAAYDHPVSENLAEPIALAAASAAGGLLPAVVSAPAASMSPSPSRAAASSSTLTRAYTDSMVESMLNLITSLANMQHTVNCISDIERRIVEDALDGGNGDPVEFVEINDSVSDIMSRIGRINKPLACSLCCVTNALLPGCTAPTVPAPTIPARSGSGSGSSAPSAPSKLYGGYIQVASVSGVGIAGMRYHLRGDDIAATLTTGSLGIMALDDLEPGEYSLSSAEYAPGPPVFGIEGLWEHDANSPYKVYVSDQGVFAITARNGKSVADMTIHRFIDNAEAVTAQL